MSERPPISAPSGLKIDDIYFVLFRHKKKILLIWALGVVAALILWKGSPVIYKSDAKILVRYVVETKNVNPVDRGADSNVKAPDQSGDGIINSELEILTSYDLALDVADLVGPEKILAKNGGGSDRFAAASVISEGLRAEPTRRSAVIWISFQNRDNAIVQPVLEQLIASYRRKHVEIHLSTGTLDDFLTQQADQARSQLAIVEQELRQAKSKAGVNSLEYTKKEHSEAITRIQLDIYEAQTELVGRLAALNLLTNRISATPTNPAAQITIPADVLDQYKRVVKRIENLEKQQEQLESAYTAESAFIKDIRDERLRNEKTRALLESQYPALLREYVAETAARPPGTLDLQTEMMMVRALEARLNAHEQRLAAVRKEAATLEEVEGTILELQRKRDVLEQNFRYFSERIERTQFDEALSTGKITNISPVQKPSPAYRDLGKLSKKLAMILGAAFAGGIALAFFIELYLDRTVKRPAEVESKLGLPLFLSIPLARKNGMARLTGSPLRRMIGSGEIGANQAVAKPVSPSDIPPWNREHELRPFFDGLRDRLIMSFELRNLTHNPKLVGITSCKSGSGVSTMASGLAASLSETGEGNVLLVDMNDIGQGAAHYFHKGRLECGLDEALELEKRENAMVQENLYVVTENANPNALPRVLHKRFSSLLPRLKASDYDYIIFDMPPVTQISPTAKLARFMDMLFVTVEAEKTDPEAIQRATTLLEEAQVQNVGVVLNKTRDYVPARLRGDS